MKMVGEARAISGLVASEHWTWKDSSKKKFCFPKAAADPAPFRILRSDACLLSFEP